LKKRVPVSFTIDEVDMTKIAAVSERLQINRSRVMSLAINFLHTLLSIECNMAEPIPKTYEEVVLSPSLLKTGEPIVEQEVPVPVKKKCGWPRGRKRGSRKQQPVLTVIEGGKQLLYEQSN